MSEPQKGDAVNAIPEPVVASPQPVQPVEPTTPVAPAPQAQPEPVQPVVTPPTESVSDNKRTSEQFEKLLNNNQQLYEANQRLQKELQDRMLANQQFAPIQQPPVPQPTPQSKAQDGISLEEFTSVDPYTGEKVVDASRLAAKVQEINQRASRAEQAISQYIQTNEQRDVERQNKETFAAYPELDPSNPSFDISLHRQTRSVIYDSLINPHDYGGKPLSFKDAADFVKRQLTKLSPSIKGGTEGNIAVVPAENPVQPITQKVEGGQDLKAQASATVAGEQPTNRPQQALSEDDVKLTIETRKGSTEALAKRLMNTPHTGTPASGASGETS